MKTINSSGARSRALRESKVRYVTVKVHEDAKKIFGLERWKPEEHTYLVEGPIDSLSPKLFGDPSLGDLSFLNKEKQQSSLITNQEVILFQT